MQCAEGAAAGPLNHRKHSPISPHTIAARDLLRGMKAVGELSQQPALLGPLQPLAYPQESLGQGPVGILRCYKGGPPFLQEKCALGCDL